MSLFEDFMRHQSTPQPQPAPKVIAPPAPKPKTSLLGAAKSAVGKIADTKINVSSFLPGPLGVVAGAVPDKFQPKVTSRQLTNAAADMTVRPVARVGYEGTKTLAKDTKAYTPTGKIEKAILGKDTLRNYNDPNRTSAKIATKAGMPKLGLPLALAGAAVDVTSISPSGAGKGIAKKVGLKGAEKVLSASSKFGKELNLYKADKAAREFADGLKLKRLFPEGVDVAKKTEDKPTSFKINDVMANLKAQGSKFRTAVSDQSGFIDFGAKIGKGEKDSKLSQSIESTKSALSDVTPAGSSAKLDNVVAPERFDIDHFRDGMAELKRIAQEGNKPEIVENFRKASAGKTMLESQQLLSDALTGFRDKGGNLMLRKGYKPSSSLELQDLHSQPFLRHSEEQVHSSIPNIVPQANGAKIGTTIKNDVKLLGPGDPEARFTDALKQAVPKRAEQEAIYKAERSAKFSKLDQAYLGAGGGEAGLKAKLGALEGQFSKVDFQPMREQVSDGDVTHLLNKIEQTKYLTTIEKVPAQKAFVGLLQGKLPTESEIAKLKMVFKPELVDAMVKNPTKMQQLANALNLPRTLMSSADLSAPLRQGIFPAMAHPKDFTRSFKNMFGYAFSEKKFQNFQQSLKERPTYLKMRDAKLDFTDLDAPPSQKEEAFISNLTDKVPGLRSIVRGSARSYTGFLNNFRADLFDTMYKNGEKLGKGNDETYLRDLGRFINTATGRGDFKDVFGQKAGGILTESAPLLNAAFFSPRLIASRMSLLNPVYYKQLEPTVRKEALKSLVAFTGTGMSLLGLAKLAGADVGVDPRSSDFGKIKVGNTRYDIWGGFQPYAVLIARQITGESISSTTGKKYTYGEGFKPTSRKDAVYRFAEGKASPIASLGIEALKGTDFQGQPLDYTTLNPLENPISKRFIPIISQDIKDTVKEYGPMGPILTIPGLFGVGSATYGPTTKTPKFKRPVGTTIR